MDKIDQFKSELKELLKKYGATIGCNVEGDTHGLSYEMVVDFGQSDNWKNHHLCDSGEVDWYDL